MRGIVGTVPNDSSLWGEKRLSKLNLKAGNGTPFGRTRIGAQSVRTLIVVKDMDGAECLS